MSEDKEFHFTLACIGFCLLGATLANIGGRGTVEYTAGFTISVFAFMGACQSYASLRAERSEYISKRFADVDGPSWVSKAATAQIAICGLAAFPTFGGMLTGIPAAIVWALTTGGVVGAFGALGVVLSLDMYGSHIKPRRSGVASQ